MSESRTWITDLKSGTDVEESYAVHAADIRQRRGGGPYLAVTLGDRTGTVTALVWENVERLRTVLEPGTVVAVKGKVQRYNQRLQLVVRSADTVPGERAGGTHRRATDELRRRARLSVSVQLLHHHQRSGPHLAISQRRRHREHRPAQRRAGHPQVLRHR